MLEGLELKVTARDAPFEPEKGAYGSHAHRHGHRHHNDDAPPTHGGVIHQFGEYAGVIKPGQSSVNVHVEDGEHSHLHEHEHHEHPR
jgi:hypothetical protein